MRLLAVALATLVACGGATPRPIHGAVTAQGDEITLYRGHAVVKRDYSVDVPDAASASLLFTVPPGVRADDIEFLEPGDLTISTPRDIAAPAPLPTPAADFPEAEDEDEELADEPPPPVMLESSTTFSVEIRAPRAGRYRIAIAYATERIRWDAAYTVTTTPARARATVRGALAVQNTALALPAARVYVVDTELIAGTGQLAAHLGSTLAAAKAPTVEPRMLGDLALAEGETRIELLADAAPRPLRSVLVYDPIGTKLDNPGARPLTEPSVGTARASTRVTESLEIVRPHASSDGLPGGPVRLLERHPDGALAVLGEARLFDVSTRVAAVDTIALATAEQVTGARERREMTYDEVGRRVTEEFVLTIRNERAYPVEVVLREHMYRGQNWVLAYHSASRPTQEGPQQFSLRTIAPARGQAKVLYVVVYTVP